MRVTGGALRSRAIASPRGDATRPTSDRVREALFGILVSRGWLGGRADGGTDEGRDDAGEVVDLCAGTGALGIEALSRGASRATFVENGRGALVALRANVASLGIEDRSTVVAVPVARAFATLLPGRARIVFLDPPYALVPTSGFPKILAGACALAEPGGVVVLEHASGDEPPDEGGAGKRLDERRRYGDTALAFYRNPGS